MKISITHITIGRTSVNQKTHITSSIFLIAGLLLTSCSGGKAPVNITQHTYFTYVTGIAVKDKAVFCATKGGLVEWDVIASQYTTYTTLDGLPSNILSDVIFDRNGVIWIGSVNGVASFDGSYFKCYDVSDGLPTNEINDLTIGPDGDLWVSTTEGAVSFRGGRFKFLADEMGPGSSNVDCIYFDQGDNIWIGTIDNGIFYQTDKKWMHSTTRDGLTVNSTVTIAQAWDRSMWASSWAGISRFDGIGWKTFSSMKRFGTYDCRQLIPTEKRLWFFTASGVHASQGGDWFHNTEDNGLISNDVFCGFVVSDEEVYAGSVNGMSVIKNDVIDNYFVPNCPVGHNCISIAVDAKERIWLGTWETGLNVYDSGHWTQLTGPGRLTLDTVRSFVFGPDESIIFNTTSGIVTEQNNTWKIETRRNGVSADDIRCGLFDQNGRYWAGTAAGICFKDGNRWKRFRLNHGLPSEDIWACAMDGRGTIWFGTSDGIVSFTDDELTDRTAEVGLDAVDVRSIAVDGNRVLFGTNDGKLIEYADGSWDVYGRNYVGTDSGIFSIAVGPSGGIWLGTNGDGIVGTGEGLEIHLKLSDGLPSNYVKSLAINGSTLWAACYGGTASIDIVQE